MKTYLRKKGIIIGIMCFMMWLLCGCMGMQLPMKIDTSFECSTSFSGKRVMSTTISESLFESAFHGDIQELQAMVTKECPATMLCSAEENDGNVEIKMTLEFGNFKDYVNKIGLILGKTPAVYYDASDSIFKNGFMLQEDFSSAELFGWLVDALKAKNSSLETKTLKDLFTSGTTQVLYDGKSFETSNCIYVADMESNAFDRISAEITMNKDGSYKADINYIIEQEIYYAMGESMDEAIKSVLPDGGLYDVAMSGKERVYTISFSALNEESLESQLNVALHTKNCKFDVKAEGDAADPFRAHKEVFVYLDGAYFLDFSQEDTEIIYKLNADSKYVVDGVESTSGFLRDSSSKTEGDYTSIYMTVGPSDETRIDLTYAVEMHKLEVYTKIINENSYERSFKFVFSTPQAKLVGKNFKKKLNGRMDSDMVLKQTDSEGYTSYIVSFSAKDLETLSKKTTHFLDGTVSEDERTFSSVITGGKADKKELKSVAYVYEEHLDFKNFLGSAVLSEGIVYHMEYPRGYNATLEKDGCSNIREENNEVQCTIKEKVFDVKSQGKTTNLVGMTQWILWWGSMILTVLSFILNLRHITGYLIKKEKYLQEVDLFKGFNILFLTIGVAALVVFVFTTFRLIFGIY